MVEERTWWKVTVVKHRLMSDVCWQNADDEWQRNQRDLQVESQSAASTTTARPSVSQRLRRRRRRRWAVNNETRRSHLSNW